MLKKHEGGGRTNPRTHTRANFESVPLRPTGCGAGHWFSGLKHARDAQSQKRRAKRKWLCIWCPTRETSWTCLTPITQEFAAALKDYCATLTTLTDHVRRGAQLLLDQMDQIEAAKLRLENARTLCELYVGRGPSPAPPQRQLPRLHA